MKVRESESEREWEREMGELESVRESGGVGKWESGRVGAWMGKSVCVMGKSVCVTEREKERERDRKSL